MMNRTIKSVWFVIALGVFTLFACDKTECHDCHYEDVNNQEVELGEYCGDDLEQIEANGIFIDGVQYEVHCHEH